MPLFTFLYRSSGLQRNFPYVLQEVKVPDDDDGSQYFSPGVRNVAGGCVFGAVPKADWEGNVPVVRKNRITLGLNCLLLQACGKAERRH
jgi:hypothetical protein